LFIALGIALAADDMLSILVFGAGAIGGYLGGSLALQGHRVVFLERPYNAPILRERGLHLQLGQHNHHIHPLEVVTELESAFPRYSREIIHQALLLLGS